MKLCAADEDSILSKYKGQRDVTVGSTGAAMLFVRSVHTMTGSQFVNSQQHFGS